MSGVSSSPLFVPADWGPPSSANANTAALRSASPRLPGSLSLGGTGLNSAARRPSLAPDEPTSGSPNVGTIGGHRANSRGPSPAPGDSLRQSMSYQAFRNAHSSSPSFASAHSHMPSSSSNGDHDGQDQRHRQQQQQQQAVYQHPFQRKPTDMTAFASISPLIQPAQSPSLKGMSPSMGTPRLFFDNQHIFSDAGSNHSGNLLSRSSTIVTVNPSSDATQPHAAGHTGTSSPMMVNSVNAGRHYPALEQRLAREHSIGGEVGRMGGDDGLGMQTEESRSLGDAPAPQMQSEEDLAQERPGVPGPTAHGPTSESRGQNASFSPSSPAGSFASAHAAEQQGSTQSAGLTKGYPFPSTSAVDVSASIPPTQGLSSTAVSGMKRDGPGELSGASFIRGTPLLNVPAVSADSLVGGLLSPTAATVGSAGQTPSMSPLTSPAFGPSSTFSLGASVPTSLSASGAVPTASSVMGDNRGVITGDAGISEFDQQARTSPFLNDVLDRLIRVELGMKDVNRQITGLARNVSLLLDRTRHLPPTSHSPHPAHSQAQHTHHQNPSFVGGHNGPSQQGHAHRLGGDTQLPNGAYAPSMTPTHSGPGQQVGNPPATSQTQEDVRSLSAQLSTLSTSVAQLLSMQGVGNAGQQQQLAGLGLGPGSMGTPQLGSVGTPQVGGYGVQGVGTPILGCMLNNQGPMPLGDRAASPHFGALSASAGGSAIHSNQLLGPDGASRMSPRPGGGSAGNRLSWSGNAMPGFSGGAIDGLPVPGRGLQPGKDVDRRWSSVGQSAIRRDSFGASEEARSHAGSASESNLAITKWEHLNLHSDLLRSILKYGLGPPNKIQQRALPFLLRGNDIIAQAPPTQERIASYVIPALQLVLNTLREPTVFAARGPIVLIISTTVDQATQAQRMALGLGSSLGIRIGVAAAGSIDVQQEAQMLTQTSPHIVVGTPQKMNDLLTHVTNRGGVPTDGVRLVVLDEVDQLIARNLSDYVSSLLRLLPIPRPRTGTAGGGPLSSPTLSPGLPPTSGFSPFEANPLPQALLSSRQQQSAAGGPTNAERQTAIFSNTVPQDVLNFAQSIHLRESVRVLVRRDGASGTLGVSGPGTASGPVNSTSGPNSISAGSNAQVDPALAALRGLRQYYLYVAVSTRAEPSGLSSPAPGIGSSSANAHASEMKLDVITDLLEDIEFGQAIIYCGSTSTLEAVTYKLASKGIEAIALHKDMANITRQQVMSKFRSSASSFSNFGPTGTPGGGRGRKALVVHDVPVNPKEVHQVPLIVMYDMPRSVEDYKEKIASAAAGGVSRPGVCVNVVTASGGPRGDIEMLRSIECHLGCKMAELPMDPKSILN